MPSNTRCLAVMAVLTLCSSPCPADAPGALATPDEKLDHLLSSWRGRSLEDLRKTWGKEVSIERRGGNKVHVFERRIKVRASIFSGVSVYNGGLTCMARFEVDEDGVVVRAGRRGGGRECWKAFRRNEPH